MNWIKHHTQTFAALTCIGATIIFCAYAIIDYESDQCHYRVIRGFDQAVGVKGWCRIL